MNTVNTIEHDRYDAIVVGARCAGAATALLLARGGMRVLAIDRSAYGSDTLSTHALMRGGVQQLARFGLLDALRATDTPKIEKVTFHYGPDAFEIPIKAKDEIDALYAPRRTVLDALLVDAARAAGAEVHHGAAMRELETDASGRVTGVAIEDERGGCRLLDTGIVIGADGLRSRVARLTGAREEHTGRHATATLFGYFAGLAVEGYHWHYELGVGAGAIPTGGGLTCVFVGVAPERYARELARDTGEGFRRVLAQAAPDLAAALGSATQAGPLRRFAGRRGFLRRPFGPGYALVGDAGYFKDPLTAHGITDALRDAELLARALIAGGSEAELRAYQAARDAIALPFFETTDAIASFAWDLPRLQALHVALSEGMVRGVRAMAALDRPKFEAA